MNKNMNFITFYKNCINELTTFIPYFTIFSQVAIPDDSNILFIP